MRKMMKRPTPSMQPWIRGWMRGAKREGEASFPPWREVSGDLSTILSAFLTIQTHPPHYRELREKDEIEKYRMERPKIQQQFSDLKVWTRVCELNSTIDTTVFFILILDAGLATCYIVNDYRDQSYYYTDTQYTLSKATQKYVEFRVSD